MEAVYCTHEVGVLPNSDISRLWPQKKIEFYIYKILLTVITMKFYILRQLLWVLMIIGILANLGIWEYFVS